MAATLTATTSRSIEIAPIVTTKTPMELRVSTPERFLAFPFIPYGIQLQLMRHVFSSIEEKKVAIVESPTGTVSVPFVEYHTNHAYKNTVCRERRLVCCVPP